MSKELKERVAYWRNAYEELVRQTGRDLNDGLGIDPRKKCPSPVATQSPSLGDQWRPIDDDAKKLPRILAASIRHDAQEVVRWCPAGQGPIDDQDGWSDTGPAGDRFWANERWFTHYKPLPAAPFIGRGET